MLRSDGDDGDGDRGRAAPRGEARERSLESGRALADAVDARRGDGDDAPSAPAGTRLATGHTPPLGQDMGRVRRRISRPVSRSRTATRAGRGTYPPTPTTSASTPPCATATAPEGCAMHGGRRASASTGHPSPSLPLSSRTTHAGPNSAGLGDAGGDILAGGGNRGRATPRPRRPRSRRRSGRSNRTERRTRDARAKPDGRAKLAERGETPRRRHGAPPSDDETVFANGCSS